MTSDACRQYLEDPESHGSHLTGCADCRAMHDELQARVAGQPLRIEELPLAPWEGAAYRSWPLVTGGALVFVALITAFFAAAGASPYAVLRDAVQRAVPSSDLLVSFLNLGGGIVQAAPVTILILFVLVNVLLFALLRRAPKGIDV